MATCLRCDGLIAEPGKVYGFAGKFCHCGWEVSQKPKVTPMTILQQCEKMSLDEVKALIVLLSAYHDAAVFSAYPGGFKKREEND